MRRDIRARMARFAGYAAGIGTHVLFAYTVWHLFWFLKDGRAASTGGNLGLDAALALMFAVPHSLLLYPAVRSKLVKVIPAAFYGLFYTVATCVSLLLLFHYWQGSDVVFWDLDGAGWGVMTAGFYASWIALFYSLYLTGLGYQTGLTPWLYWVRGEKPPRRGFDACGAYRFIRHPVYLSFMGLVWFTPHMSLDHVILTGIWTMYLFVGSYLKDRRLAYFLGDSYLEYQSRVPGFPLMPFGPLARIPVKAPTTDQQTPRRAA
ncbi:methyltransferase family protein [Aeoliella mucimassa]|uniref:NnrU protein n=1 Tax=Aeoliella mucimassa TaxID=2527972 RepID=A0A518ALV4_9BACT|nr:NnrU family protein [Aeoliella mucimassa]QDU55710.1 NnrU protein [Aeoliella mucimassa]